MARNMQPILKRCKALRIEPAVMGISKHSKRNPQQNARRKVSEYGMQLNAKQKVKFIYGIQEKQFRSYYEKATKAPGISGQVLLQICESRLDNVVFRLGLAVTRREARQMVVHNHFTLNGKKCNIPSLLVKEGDVIAVSEKSKGQPRMKQILEIRGAHPTPQWLEYNADALEGKVVGKPSREDIDYDIEEHLIIELYSK